MNHETEAILLIEELELQFPLRTGPLYALKGIDLEIYKGETIGLVGETGCGKSVLAISIVGLVPPPGRVVRGRIVFNGTELTKKTPEELRLLRQNQMAIVFQDPNAYLDPVFTIYEQVSEAVAVSLGYEVGSTVGPINLFRTKYSSKEKSHYSAEQLEETIRDATLEALRKTRMPSPEKTKHTYPHELSGGMKQRVMLAMAITKNPQLLILDEATTGLDVTTQAQILVLLKELRKQLDTTIVMITHDLGVASEICDRIAVMYAGEIVEIGSSRQIIEKPLHPYTEALLRAIPRIDTRGKPLEEIPGSLPSAMSMPPGCLYSPRCKHAMQKCERQHPKTTNPSPDRQVRCYLYGE